MLGALGLMVTDATGTFATVTVAVPLFPSLAAAMATDPAATPVTSPLPETVASALLLDAQVTVRPDGDLGVEQQRARDGLGQRDRKSTRLKSSHFRTSYDVFG